jgi:hypothetical protein
MLTKAVSPSLQTTNGINTDHEVSGPGLATTIVKRADENYVWVLDSVQVSYDFDGPVKGGLVIKDGEKTVFDIDIVYSMKDFNFYIPASPNEDLSITLKSGGDGVIGKLNVQTHLE